MRRLYEKAPSGVSTKTISRKVRNQYIAGDIYDFSDNNRYIDEDTYTDTEGNGYITDKAGNEYLVKCSTTMGDAGRIAGGSTDYDVHIYISKDLVLSFHGHMGIFSLDYGTGIINDIDAGYYLEDYVLKHKQDMSTYRLSADGQAFVDQLLANADPDAKSTRASKAERAADREKAFDDRYIKLDSDWRTGTINNFECKIENGKVVASPAKFRGREEEFEVPQNILDEAIVLFEINGYTFEDFEGCTFKISMHTNYDLRYDTVNNVIEAYEQHGTRKSKIDFSRIPVGITEIKINTESAFGKKIIKAYKQSLGRKSDYLNRDRIYDRQYSILGTYGTAGGYSDTAFGLGSSEGHMRTVRANARRHAIEELSSAWDTLQNTTEFEYDKLKSLIEKLPAKVLDQLQSAPVEATNAAEAPVEGVEEKFTPDPVAVQKMTAWHEGTRRQNVGACSDVKLKMYYKTCKALGFEQEATILANEAEARNLKL